MTRYAVVAPDGKVMAVTDGPKWIADGAAKSWGAETGEDMRVLEVPGAVDVGDYVPEDEK